MKSIRRLAAPISLAAALSALLFINSAAAQTAPRPKYPNFPSETPAKLEPVTDSFDYARRSVMIPMRDGVKLHTVILVRKGANGTTWFRRAARG
jgi:hypothetical protein